MTRFRVVPERSKPWIEGSSDLHPIHGEAMGLEGEAEVAVRMRVVLGPA